MTIADVLNRWRCDAATQAVKVARNYQYGIACNTDMCTLMRKVYALQLVRDNRDCGNTRKVEDWLMPGSITAVTLQNNTESDSCQLVFTDITTGATCANGLTFTDINPLTGS